MDGTNVSWVVVGDAGGARIFKFEKQNEPWSLVESISGDGKSIEAATRDFGKKASEHKGALHGHGENHNAAKETTERRFAHVLAHALEKGLADKAFGKLVIVAQAKLLGELRENLSRGLHEKVVAEVSKDYVHLSADELRKALADSIPDGLKPQS